MAAVLLTALIASQVTLSLIERIGKGAATPTAAATAYLSALQRGDGSKIDDLTVADRPHRTDRIDLVMVRYSGLQGSVSRIDDTASSGMKAAFVDARMGGRQVQLEMFLSRTRGRWFVSTFGPPV